MVELVSPFIVNDEPPPEAVVAAPEGELVSPFKGPDYVPPEPGTFDLVTGASKNPEGLGSFTPEKVSDNIIIAGKSFFARDQFGKANIIKQQIPDAEFEIDDNFNVIVNHNGKREFIDKPGLDLGDVTQFAGDVLKYSPSVKAGAPLKTLAKTELGKRTLAGIGVGTGAAVTSVASDVIGDVAGAEQGISGANAGFAAAGGALFEFLGPLVGKFINKVLPKKDLYKIRMVDGESEVFLTQKGEALAKKLGIATADMTASLAKAFDDAIKAGIDPANAVKVAENQAANIRISQGQVTGNKTKLELEDTARNADVSSTAGTRMRQFDEDQAQDIVNASDDIQLDAAGKSERIQRPNEGGGIITERIKGAESSLSSRVDEAYELARESNASLTGDSLLDMYKAIKASVKGEGVASELHPATSRVLADINKFIRTSRTKGKTLKDVDMQFIERQRRILGNRYDSAANAGDRRLVGIMKRKMDEWVSDAIDNTLFSGDQNALELLKNARGLNTEWRKKFFQGGPKDVAGRTIETFVKSDVNVSEAVNHLFGAGKLGAKQASYHVIKRVEQIFGKGSEEMGILRQMAWQKIVGGSTLRGNVSAKNLVKSIDDVLEGGGEGVMSALFSPKELAQIKVFRNAVNNTIVPGNVGNPSRTAHKIAVLAQQAMKALGMTVAVGTGGAAGAAAAGGIAGAAKVINWAALRGVATPLKGSLATTGSAAALEKAAGNVGLQQFQRGFFGPDRQGPSLPK